MATLATGTGLTVSVAVPDFPSLVAVIVVVPTPTAVARPDEFTVAAAGLLDVQANVRPVTVFPCASLAVAVNCFVCVTRIVAVAGATAIDAIGVNTVIADVPLLPSLLAVIVAVPSATAVTSPDAETDATAGMPTDKVAPELQREFDKSQITKSQIVDAHALDTLAIALNEVRDAHRR